MKSTAGKASRQVEPLQPILRIEFALGCVCQKKPLVKFPDLLQKGNGGLGSFFCHG
ncbi:hypothetical protein SAMN05192553_11711 [Cyclobacterium xiamenense]|uniref:Uncharacterized protein n=1 Tax=Cyclobacterium xiamenense TaxID=1297121 RepID=A0A1H7BWM2_9BACT|nr:hypothetical protein SAMN05192553_11711 [Cyclobacterium xiamenense]